MEDPARDVLVLSSTQMGKSFCDAAWLTKQVWEHPSRTHPWWWVSPVSSQAMIGFRYMVGIGLSAGIIAGRPAMSPHPKIPYINGGFVEFRSAEVPENLMGPPILGGVVDEAGLIDQWAHAAISTRRSATLGPLRFSGNPGPMSGTFKLLCGLAEQAAADPQSEWRGVYSLHKWTWRDKYAWLQGVDPQRAEQYRRFIEQERQSVKPLAEFLRLYEAEWTEDEAAVFRGLGAPDGAPLDGPVAGHDYVIGVDVGQQTDYLVATVACATCRRLDAMERWRGIPYPQCGDRLAEMSSKWDAPVIVEVNGPGIAVYQDLQQRGVNVIPFTTTGPSKQEIIVGLAAELERGEGALRIADMPPLHTELRSYRYQRMPSGNYRYGAPEGEHDDCVMSAAFAVHGITHRPHAGLMSFMQQRIAARTAPSQEA